jgi:hypothetical protein
MSRKLAVLFLAMLVLAGAMSLKTIVTAHSSGTVVMANGSAPCPPLPKKPKKLNRGDALVPSVSQNIGN